MIQIIVIMMLLVGISCMWIGILVWKREKISLIHSYHYTRVKECDKKPYTALVGKGVFIIGVGIILTSVIEYVLKTMYGWIAFGVCLVIGLILIGKAQKKYNGGLF